ncbi:MAG: hypothetical protein ACPHUL_00085 [Marinomonas gallaica]
MKNILTVAAVYLISGCSSTGYNVANHINNTQDKTGAQLKITVDVYKDTSKFQEAVWEKAYGLKGQALYQIGGDECHIKVLESDDNDLDEVIGHEMMHCLFGDFHKHK